MNFISARRNASFRSDIFALCATYISGAFLFDFIVYNRAISKVKNNSQYLREMIHLEKVLKNGAFLKYVKKMQ